MLTAIDEPRTAIECLKLGAYDYLIKPVDLDELEMSLQSGLRQRQLEIDRRELEQWLAREVAVRTRDLEERTTVVEDVALAALAAAGDWPGASDAVEKLAKELGTSPEDVTREIRKRRVRAPSACHHRESTRAFPRCVSDPAQRAPGANGAGLPPPPPPPPPPPRLCAGRPGGARGRSGPSRAPGSWPVRRRCASRARS